jgi:hypothetical protein
VVVRTARTCRARNRVQRVSGGSNGPEKASTGMLAWVGGSLVATILSLLLLTGSIGDPGAKYAFERTLKPAPAAAGSTHESGPTQR